MLGRLSQSITCDSCSSVGNAHCLGACKIRYSAMQVDESSEEMQFIRKLAEGDVDAMPHPGRCVRADVHGGHGNKWTTKEDNALMKAAWMGHDIASSVPNRSKCAIQNRYCLLPYDSSHMPNDGENIASTLLCFF